MRLELTRSNDHYPLKVARLPIPPSGHFRKDIFKILRGAKNGTRTRDPNLGKVVLYQLSYFRIGQSGFFRLRCKGRHIFHSGKIIGHFFSNKSQKQHVKKQWSGHKTLYDNIKNT